MSDLTVKSLRGREMTQNVPQKLTGVMPQVKQLTEVITCLRTELNKDLPIQHIALLLAVVQQPGISMQDLMTQLGMPQGTVSRNVKLLADNGRGYGLLRNEQGMVNRKQVVVYPTKKCIDLIVRLCQLMPEAGAEDSTHICRCANAS